jgi:murein DD-endopeptidase MepM/ murein hydrolase activator NlpD
MPHHRWTVLVVPHGSDSPRSISVSRRSLRVAGSTVALIGLFALLGVGVVLSGFTGPPAFVVGHESATASKELRQLRSQLALLRDTVGALQQRDEQLRLLAGLSTPSDVAGTTALASADAPDPASSVGVLAIRTSQIDVAALLRRATGLLSSFAEISDTIRRNSERMASTPSIMPTAGWLSSHFSMSRVHPILHEARPHEGIDVAAPMGAPIVAPASGRVTSVKRVAGYGLMLEVDHGNGIVTIYAHCSRVTVREGQRVTRGMMIAAVGNSGLSTGPHLHYEIHVNGRVVDPLSFVLPMGSIAD